MKDWLKIIGIIVLLTTLVISVTYVDYYMFKRAHPNAGFLEYLWERD